MECGSLPQLLLLFFTLRSLPPPPPSLLSLIACPEKTELANRSGSNHRKRTNIRSPFPLHHFLPFNVNDTKASFTFGFFPSLTLPSLHFFQARNVRPWKCCSVAHPPPSFPQRPPLLQTPGRGNALLSLRQITFTFLVSFFLME